MTLQPFLKLAARLAAARDEVDHVRRNVDRLDRVDERALDRLFDPPRCVGGEPRTLRWIKAFDRADQTDVAFLDEVGQRQSTVGVVLRDGNDEPKVRADHAILCVSIVVIHNTPT